jgi:hypothetical protein
VTLGYEEGSKAYRLFDPRAGKVLVSMAAWDWDSRSGEAAGGSNDITFTIEHMVIYDGGNAIAEAERGV